MSPLISLIEEINNLRALGLSSVNISDPEVDSLRVEKGEYSIVYGSPEAWLTSERWRNMLSNGVNSRNLCAVGIDEAHVLRQ